MIIFKNKVFRHYLVSIAESLDAIMLYMLHIYGLFLLGHIVLIQTLTIPHSPDGGAGSDKCCPSSETPSLLSPLQMEERSLAASQNLEQTDIFKNPS